MSGAYTAPTAGDRNRRVYGLYLLTAGVTVGVIELALYYSDKDRPVGDQFRHGFCGFGAGEESSGRTMCLLGGASIAIGAALLAWPDSKTARRTSGLTPGGLGLRLTPQGFMLRGSF